MHAFWHTSYVFGDSGAEALRPVNKGTNPPYTTGTNFTFGGKNVKPIKAIIPSPTATVSYVNCLSAWLKKVKDEAPTGGTRKQQTVAVAAIKNQVGNVYKLASVPLTQRLGPFCSFCETPLPGLLEVEHCVPKALYPTFSLSWDNFLLACGPCNTAKGNQPSRETVQGWLNNDDPTEQQYYDSIRVDHYVWPDLDATAYRWLPLDLQYFSISSNDWSDLDEGWANNPNNEIISTDIATRTVIARLYDPDDNTTFHDRRVRVVVTTSASGTVPAASMIALCNFNAVNNVDSTYDRRLMNRTIAWFTCMKFLNMYLKAPDDPTKSTFMTMIQYMAVATGFYSIWVQCIDYQDTDLAKNFVAETNKANFFPGTNATNVP